MPISRPFSRRLRADSGNSLKRQFSSKGSKPVSTDKISLPIELISTTNVLSYDAPDVAVAKLNWRYSRFECALHSKGIALNAPNVPNTPPALSPSNSARNSSDDELSTAPTTPTSPLSPRSTPAMTDGSSATSADSSPVLELNHLSEYFPSPGPAALKRSQSCRLSRKPSTVAEEPVPALPKRASSHSKREHERVARQRSLRRSPQLSEPASPNRSPAQLKLSEIFSSSDIAASPTDKAEQTPTTDPGVHHPFSAELEQLNEVADDYHGVVQSLMDDEASYMQSLGLSRFRVEEYQALLGLPMAWNEVFEVNASA